MSRASRRNLGHGGDGSQDHYANQDVSRSKIRFITPSKCDLKLSIPRELTDLADRGGKHRDDLRYELALLWRRYVQDGEFQVSMRLLDEMYSGRYRMKLKRILDTVAICVKNHSSFAGSEQCKTYKFRFARPKKCTTYSDIPEIPPDPTLPRASRIRVVLPGVWLWNRYERWVEICQRHDWTSNLDLDGRTDWGRPLLSALESVRIPDAPETVRLTKRGVMKAAVRKKGRCYHAMTNLRKDLRRDSLIDGEPTAEVDIHACYTAVLISRLPDGATKNQAIKAIQTDWYAQFGSAFAKWFDRQCATGKGYIGNDGEWMMRLDDDPKHDVPASIKVEYLRQCLFWRDGRDGSSPLRVELRRLHPGLCRLIERWRNKLSPTELSDILTRAEGSMVVDCATAELERACIKAIPTHDAVMVPISKADAAHAILLSVCELHLGFAPKVSVKNVAAETLTRQ